MSILVKGMEMPKSCDDCRLNNGISCYAVPEYTEDCVAGKTDDRPNWCPLVEIPPHGRLIDADALEAQCDDPYWCVWLTDIKDAPTIIPAEEGE